MLVAALRSFLRAAPLRPPRDGGSGCKQGRAGGWPRAWRWCRRRSRPGGRCGEGEAAAWLGSAPVMGWATPARRECGRPVVPDGYPGVRGLWTGLGFFFFLYNHQFCFSFIA